MDDSCHQSASLNVGSMRFPVTQAGSRLLGDSHAKHNPACATQNGERVLINYYGGSGLLSSKMPDRLFPSDESSGNGKKSLPQEIMVGGQEANQSNCWFRTNPCTTPDLVIPTLSVYIRGRCSPNILTMFRQQRSDLCFTISPIYSINLLQYVYTT